MDMDQEIRDASPGDIQDKTQSVEGTYQFAPPEPDVNTSGGSSSGEGGGGGGGGQEFPRASEEEVIEAAERAKAQFGGTFEGGGKGPESAADTQIAQGEKPGPFQQTDQDQTASSGGGSDPTAGTEDLSNLSDSEVAGKIADEMKEQGPPEGGGDDLTTGQKLAGIMSSDPNMQAESKIVGALSGGDDDEATGNA
ncbi:MAG TPA: hypothetical protein VHJ78_06390 [Actinomycetota bacterium]|nr:hypothetical protein [Actinomycetota bacterium]